MTVDTKKRLTAAEALRHPWLNAQTAKNNTSIPGLPERMREFNVIRHTGSQKYVIPEAENTLPIDKIEQEVDDMSTEDSGKRN